MTALALFNLPILLVALAIGLVTGWWAFRRRSQDQSEPAHDLRHHHHPDHRRDPRRPHPRLPGDAAAADADRAQARRALCREPRPALYEAGGDGPEGNGVTDEVAAATTDVAGEVLGVDAHGQLGAKPAGPADDLVLLKGVGPKLAARLNELGVTRFAQLAGMNETELAHLDERMGPFRGRLARDRVAEQADYLARGDIESFEEKFGKLGSENQITRCSNSSCRT